MRLLVCFFLIAGVGCDSDNALQLQDRVEVARNGFISVQIATDSDVMEVGLPTSLTASAAKNEAGTITTDVTDTVLWSSSDNSIATVSSTGIVTGMTDGEIILTASLGPLSDSVVLLVSSAPLLDIVISQQTTSTVNECSNVSYTASGVFSDGERNITKQVDWLASGSGVVGFFDNNGPAGFLRTISAGSLVVSATRDEITSGDEITSEPVALTVLDNLQEINLPEPSKTLTVSNSVNYTAIATYSDVTGTIDITDNATWSVSGLTSSSFGSVVKGLVDANQTGEATLTAMCGGITGELDIRSSGPIEVTELFFGRSTPFEVSLNGATEYQLQAFARFDDGTNTEVTEDAEWRVISSNNDLFTLSNVDGSKGEVFISGVGRLVLEVSYVDEDTDGDPTLIKQFEIISR